MSNEGFGYNPFAYNFPHSAKDEYAQGLLERLNLPKDASLADIEPTVRLLWERMPQRHEAIELVLGRYVTSEEVSARPVMGNIILIEDPEIALFDLLLLRAVEDLHPPNTEPY